MLLSISKLSTSGFFLVQDTKFRIPQLAFSSYILDHFDLGPLLFYYLYIM